MPDLNANTHLELFLKAIAEGSTTPEGLVPESHIELWLQQIMEQGQPTGNFVRYTEQELSDSEQAQARENISAAGGEDLAPVYDATVAYKAGILLSYQGKLYECIKDATAGTLPTNTTYFKEVSVAEKIGDLQTGLENGTIVPNKSRATESIENVSDESGTTQDNPFISQGTGTNNNVDSVDTSPVAKQIEKQGYTVANNQFVPADVNTETKNGITLTNNNDGTYTLNGEATADVVFSVYGNSALQGKSHYWLYGFINLSSSVTGLIFRDQWSYYYTGTITVRQFSGSFGFAIVVSNGTTLTNVKVRPQVRDLTQYFNGNSNIPQDLLDNPSHWSWYDNGTGSYDAGSLKNASGRYLVCTHRNLFNKNTLTSGKVIGVNGAEMTLSGASHSDYFVAIPNRVYYVKNVGITSAANLFCCYDNNKNYIGASESYNSNPKLRMTLPNTRYVIINVRDTEIASQSVELYYSALEGGEGYGDEHPYQEPSVYDTGTEELLAFDKKLPSGVIERNTGEVTFDGSDDENWSSYGGSTSTRFSISISDIVPSPSTSVVADIKCSRLVTVTKGQIASSEYAISAGDNNTQAILVRINSNIDDVTELKSWLSSNPITIQYPLATPTTEQGTSFAENIEIDDYGMMYWLDTDGNLVDIPQGVKVFYPADYVLWLDTAVSTTNGDATDIALKSEITDSALADRGYNKTSDLSSEIVTKTNIDLSIKRLVKCGNVVTLTIFGTNNTGDTITPGMTLFELPQEARVGVNFGTFAFINEQAGLCGLMVSQGGVIAITPIPDGKNFTIAVSYVVG